MKRIVLTGGPGAGKTTILDVLAGDGVRIGVDVAREIIRERLAAGLSPRPSPKEFSQESFRRNVAAYEEAGQHELTIFERGVSESIASRWIRGVISKAEADRLMARYRYDEPVLVTPPWREIYTTDSERDQSYEHSERVFEEIVEWYQRYDYQIKMVRTGPVPDRVNDIRNELGLTNQ